MSWKDKDWDDLTFYNNDINTLKKAVKDFLSYGLYGRFSEIEYEYYKKIVLSRYDKNIFPLDEKDNINDILQSIANKYNVYIEYTFLSTCYIDIKPINRS